MVAETVRAKDMFVFYGKILRMRNEEPESDTIFVSTGRVLSMSGSTPPDLSVRRLRVLILSTDRQAAAQVEGVVCVFWPDAKILVERSVAMAVAALTRAPFDLLITDFMMRDGDVCRLVRDCAVVPRRARWILLLTARRDVRALALVRELPIDGAFDSVNEEANRLAPVLAEITRGKKYFSDGFLRFPWERAHLQPQGFHLLTAAEVLILALFGDGSDRQTVAVELELAFDTISSVCRELHRKLGAHHDRDLMRISAEAGLVRVGPNGIERLGFELLVEDYEAAQKKKRPRSPFIAALCASTVLI